MDPAALIARHYQGRSQAKSILLAHGENVARKALTAAGRVADRRPDLVFIRQAALLHDIGMLYTDTPQLGCYGNHPYVCHGILGRALLEAEGLMRHALVCERHVGVGITPEDIRRQHLPLPLRDMRPVSIEEQIICYADKFFSKNGAGHDREKSVAEILQKLTYYGIDQAARFERWVELFGS
ncbi:MAG: HD domain-containing protein [Desulfobacterales bacterium]